MSHMLVCQPVELSKCCDSQVTTSLQAKLARLEDREKQSAAERCEMRSQLAGFRTEAAALQHREQNLLAANEKLRQQVRLPTPECIMRCIKVSVDVAFQMYTNLLASEDIKHASLSINVYSRPAL